MEDPEHNSPESLDNYLINKVLTQSRQQSSDCQYCGFNMPTSISLYYHSGERLRGVIYATVQDTLWFRGLRDQDFPPPHRTWGRHNDVVGVVGIDSGCSARLIRGLKLCLLCGKQRKNTKASSEVNDEMTRWKKRSKTRWGKVPLALGDVLEELMIEVSLGCSAFHCFLLSWWRPWKHHTIDKDTVVKL